MEQDTSIIKINNFSLDLSYSFDKILKLKPKRVLIQLPDGFKYSSKHILDIYNSRFPKTTFYCWLNSNFGSCDIPLGLESLNFDLIIHFGHVEWR
jgi:2-(3-amino-3-carboxypropyl)histidine synthase